MPDRDPGGVELTTQELELLRALASAPSMESVARQVGSSARHTRRRVRELLKKLGVGHARAAVALAVQRGWISVPDSGPSDP